MNVLQTHLALRAASEGQAVRKTLKRHVHLSSRPFSVVGYHLAGDLGALLCLMWGTSESLEPKIMVVPEPRNRALRFASLEVFASDLVNYLGNFSDVDSKGDCLDAPQIIVPNSSTADWLCGIVGRFTRNLRTDGDAAAPPAVVLAGKHLSFFGDLLPGSSLLLNVVDALTMHWQTGQLQSEDQNLGALLGWIAPAPGTDGRAAARQGERQPPAGPDTDPHWDADVLAGLIQDWHASVRSSNERQMTRVRDELAQELRLQLLPAWLNCWQAYGLLNSLLPGNHVSTRWSLDCKNWNRHRMRIAEDRARFRNIPNPVQSAERLRKIEDRTRDLAYEMAWDDPLVMAAHVASGEALLGRVVALDPQRAARNVRGNLVCRPLVTIEPSLPFSRPIGTVLYMTDHPSVAMRIVPSNSPEVIDLEILEGANTSRTQGRLPRVADELILSPFGKPKVYPRQVVEVIPWTHVLPTDPDEAEV